MNNGYETSRRCIANRRGGGAADDHKSREAKFL